MLTALEVLLVAGLITQAASFATSIYLHRVLAHRSLQVGRVLGFVFQFILWMTTGQRRDQWVAVHRKHHQFTDRPGDPHSPRLLGYWRVQILNFYYYAREARNPETLARYTTGLEPNWWDRLQATPVIGSIVSFGGPVSGITVLCLVFGLWPGLAMGLVHATLYVFVLAPLINAYGHRESGARNYPDQTACNSPILALVTAGESLHNNHHADPGSPRFSFRRREFDPSWPVIKLLAALGLLQITGRHVRV